MRVLIIEDTAAVAGLLDAVLRADGMDPVVSATGSDALMRKLRFQPNVVLIDLGLPDIDGIDLVRRFAQDGDCGLIVVTANDAEVMRVAVLDAGADDYVVKPVGLRELVARIRAVHRRSARTELPAHVVHGPRIVLDTAHRCLSGPNRIVTPLTEAEYLVLACLLEAVGAPVSRDQLGRVALKRNVGEDDRSVDQLVLKLRRKVVIHGVSGRAILSTRGLGYVLLEPTRFVIDTPLRVASTTR